MSSEQLNSQPAATQESSVAGPKTPGPNDAPSYQIAQDSLTQALTVSPLSSANQAPKAPVTFRLEQFEGPLDLLLFLIQNHELDISRLSLTKITDQYLAYVRLMQELCFDTASDFLVMAATLVQWKSKALLPVEPGSETLASEEDDSPLTPEDLLRQLREHQMFLAAGQQLAARPKLHEDVFARANARPPIERVWRAMDLSDLTLSMQDTLVRANRRKKILRKETVSLSTKIADFADRLTIGQTRAMRELLSLNPDRPEVVVTFLAGLELAKLKKMKLFQEGAYQDIYMKLLASLQGLAGEWTSEFENPIPKAETKTETLTDDPTKIPEGWAEGLESAAGAAGIANETAIQTSTHTTAAPILDQKQILTDANPRE